MAKAKKAPNRGSWKKGERPVGRTKGTPNKVTAAFKMAVLAVYHRMGEAKVGAKSGEDAFLEWAQDNRTEFYKICARLIPHEVIGPGAGGEHVVKTIIHEHITNKPVE